MLYIGFSNYSNKIHARLLCKKYKHCAPIIVTKDNVEVYQFVHINKIVKICIQKNDLQTLKKHGWKLVKISTTPDNIRISCGLTCVQFTKKFCDIKNIWIQTPLALFKYLTEK